jgi:Family of unknown function (DUF6353)
MKLVPEVIGQTISRNALIAQKNSPQVLFGVGVAGVVTSTVLACRATLKMDEVLEEAQEKIKKTEIVAENPEYEYTERDQKKDIKIIRVQTSIKITRLYAPAIIVGGLSIAALTRSHTMLNKRNAALTAAYGALSKGFDEYRGRVIEKYGEDQDRDFRYGTRKVEIEHPNDPTKTKKVTRVGLDEPSIYARFFDESSSSWSKEPEYNLIFLKCQQNYSNDLLRARGHVFLNEVYDMLGIPRSKAGSVVGWVLSKERNSDNYINFGVFDGKTERQRDFVNGFEGAILLDFNVDGVIFDQLDE